MLFDDDDDDTFFIHKIIGLKQIESITMEYKCHSHMIIGLIGVDAFQNDNIIIWTIDSLICKKMQNESIFTSNGSLKSYWNTMKVMI